MQLISFSLKENINILIEKKSIIKSPRFKQEILSTGNVYFFDDKKIYGIKCTNENLANPENYKCFEIEGKKIFFLSNLIIQFFGKLLVNLMRTMK